MPRGADDVETIHCVSVDEWDAWLTEHSESRPAVWLTIARKGTAAVGLSAAEAGDVAICHGWIDGHRRGLDASHFLQRYSPRRPRSPWSRVNVERVVALEAAGRMRPGGRRQVEAAQADGRWAGAYPPQSTATIPAELAAELAGNERARTAYEALGRSEQYGLYLPLLKARTPAERARALRRALSTLDARSA
jgi:uncharacterized protein YdeI (YjbR/CyaY-like superfamily)